MGSRQVPSRQSSTTRKAVQHRLISSSEMQCDKEWKVLCAGSLLTTQRTWVREAAESVNCPSPWPTQPSLTVHVQVQHHYTLTPDPPRPPPNLILGVEMTIMQHKLRRDTFFCNATCLCTNPTSHNLVHSWRHNLHKLSSVQSDKGKRNDISEQLKKKE